MEAKQAKSDWPSVKKLLTGLWPSTHQKHLNDMVEEIWKNKVGHLPLDRVVLELKKWSAESPWYPKAGQIYHACTRKSGREEEKASSKEHWNKEIKEYEESWRTATAVFNSISRQEQEEHKQSALEQDWRLFISKDSPVDSKPWMAIINRRIRKGIKSTEPDPSLKVPKKPIKGHHGNLQSILMPKTRPFTKDKNGYPEI